MFVVNPRNSTDWSTDTSCYIKLAWGVFFNYPDLGQFPALYMDKFSFNMSSDKWDPIYDSNTVNFGYNKDEITEFVDFESKT